jgi:uncharacterized Zn-finger protein
METSLTHHHRLPAQSPFDQFADPFDLANRRDSGADADRPESWSSDGENNDDSPLGDSAHDSAMDAPAGLAGGANGARAKAGEAKKKRFICPHCTRTFARSGHLQRHERSRTTPELDGC